PTRTRAHRRSTSPGVVKSAARQAICRPKGCNSRSACCKLAGSRPTNTRSAPASARAWAISRPSPRLPPVIRTRRPSRRNLSQTLMFTTHHSRSRRPSLAEGDLDRHGLMAAQELDGDRALGRRTSDPLAELAEGVAGADGLMSVADDHVALANSGLLRG